jgi:hypothetical protein
MSECQDVLLHIRQKLSSHTLLLVRCYCLSESVLLNAIVLFHSTIPIDWLFVTASLEGWCSKTLCHTSPVVCPVNCSNVLLWFGCKAFIMPPLSHFMDLECILGKCKVWTFNCQCLKYCSILSIAARAYGCKAFIMSSSVEPELIPSCSMFTFPLLIPEIFCSCFPV